MASDQGLHCLPMSHKKDAKLIWVNFTIHTGSFKLDLSFLGSCLCG